jgi:hypothetical protein
MGNETQITNRKNKVNSWFVNRYNYLASHNKEKLRNEIIKECRKLEIHVTHHIIYNWTYHATQLKGYVANIVKPILEKWEKIDEQERIQAKKESQSIN